MFRRCLPSTLALLLLLAACSDSNVGPGPDSDLRGQVRTGAGAPVADAAVFLEYSLDINLGSGSAPNGLAAKPATAIRYDLPVASETSVWVTDFCRADTVRSLLQDDLPAGSYTVVWNGLDDSGRLVPDGVYWCQVRTPTSHIETAALLLHLGYGDLTPATAVAAPARSDTQGNYRLEQDCLPLEFTFPQTDELGEPVGTVAIERRVRVWAAHPDHGLGHTGWLTIDDARGLAADITLAP